VISNVPDSQTSILMRGKRFFSSPQCPDRLRDHPTLYPMGAKGSFPEDKVTTGVGLITYFHLVSRETMVELYLQSPTHLHGMVLN
jgi:hypothetical protein